MTTQLHPLHTTEQLRETYLRYLKTIYPFRDPALRHAFWQALEVPDRLVKGPMIESALPFVNGASIADLVSEGILSDRFGSLCSAALPFDRTLYHHQEQAIRKVTSGRNVIVATGTGSGKTETFLVPILDHLLREETAGTLAAPGVRALLLYPMNALVNDQLKRLRRLLAQYPSITFGRYTGETQNEDGDAQTQFQQQFPGEDWRRNELISRRRLRATPPHLLITNYAMLEYLLLRPDDCELFDGETGRHWRYLVLDEAHTYDGAIGIELAMLLRRLKDRIVGNASGRLICIATSATLGKGPTDYPAATEFASQLFGEAFEWLGEDSACQDVVAAKRTPVDELGLAWGKGTPAWYAELSKVIHLSPEHQTPHTIIQQLTQACAGIVPAAIIDIARAEEDASRFLYEVLRGDGRLRDLLKALQDNPRLLHNTSSIVFDGMANAQDALVNLIDLAVRAKPSSASAPLLPARYHVFARALEGAFVCLNAQAHADFQPRLFLKRHDRCPECDARVFEVASCTRCGATYVVGQAMDATDGHQVLHPLSTGFSDLARQLIYLLLDNTPAQTDEDEDDSEEPDVTTLAGDAQRCRLCLHCGAILDGADDVCGCVENSTLVSVTRVDLGDQPELPGTIQREHRLSFAYRTGCARKRIGDGPVSATATLNRSPARVAARRRPQASGFF